MVSLLSKPGRHLCKVLQAALLCLCLCLPGYAQNTTVYGGQVINATLTDSAVLCNRSQAQTVYLPANANPGKTIVVIDASGNAATYNITVLPSSGTVNKTSSYTINTDNGFATFIWSGSNWQVGAISVASSSGGSAPGGSSGQIQYNNANALGGFTVSGDGTLNTTTGSLVVTRTNGSVFSASATTDTTNATNITSGTLPAAQVPNPSATTLGGIRSLAAVASKWINTISTSGVPSATQPAVADVTGAAASGVNTDITAIRGALTGLALNLQDVSPVTISKTWTNLNDGAAHNLPLHDQVSGNIHFIFGGGGSAGGSVQVQAGDNLYLDSGNFPAGANVAIPSGAMMIISSSPVSGVATNYQGVILRGTSDPPADQTITAAGTVTVAHKLGRVPVGLYWQLVNQTGELGYTAGQVVSVGGDQNITVVANTNGGFSAIFDATNLTIRYGSDANTFVIPHATTGVATAITNANWKLRLRPL